MTASTNERSPFLRRAVRAVVFRVIAVVLSLSPLLLAESLLIALDWGRPELAEDPFVGFRSVRPLFVLSGDGTQYEIPEARQAFFRPESFRRTKRAKEFRIFCLGGSTVQGRPFAIETSFTTWLELALQAADPSREWQVINCGGVSYASYRLVPIVQEVLAYEPDLIILYTGHNEFLEDRTYRQVKRMPGLVAVPSGWVGRTRTGNLLRQGYLALRGRRMTPKDHFLLRTEVDAVLDYRNGLAAYRRDETWRQNVISHFRFNLERMVRITRDAGVPLLIVNPVSKLRGCPPFKSEHREDLRTEERERWEALVAEAAACSRSDPHRSLERLRQALEIDDCYAGLHYLLADACDRLGMCKEARRHYLLAKETDICPLRMLEPMHEAVLDVARRRETPLVDVRRAIEQISRDGIPGDEHLLDHVHPTIETHKLIANWLMERLIEIGVVQPERGWKSRRDELYRQHYASLDALYFTQGLQRLEALRAWTQGRAEGQPGQTPASELDP